MPSWRCLSNKGSADRGERGPTFVVHILPFRYIDLVGFAWKRKFYVGVAKYIIWPETTKIRLLTTTHHVWFLPLCLWIVHPTAKYSSFDVSIYLLACILCQILVIIGRISTPK